MLKFILAVFTCFLLAGTVTGQPFHSEYLKNLTIRSIGPAAMSGRITAIAADPVHPEVIYAGAASGGVWRSKSGGTGWEPIFDKAPTQSIGSITVNPRNPDEIWVGTGEGNPRNSQNFGAGIFKSIDGGKNWSCMGLRSSHAIYRILLQTGHPEVVWAACIGSSYGPNEERGVFKSTDSGKTWRKVLYVNDLTGCADLIADPENPNKLYAAMWEYQRWPWFFKSGGKGSGLYVSFDAGETWERRTSKEGLPEGELGRIGLAVAKSKPDIVYALVEAKDNALYKSTDGGKNWKQMATRGQGDRPFYYSELYVNPTNENTVYSVHSSITRSIDGGRTFEGFAGWEIHPDHHAFWINPNDPDYMIDGNDGGLNITRDGGKTWRYAENIPVGQFYHVNVDNEMPYNIYGGLQDNGSWVGPSAVWKNGGIRNSDWQEVNFGDGFDVSPKPDDNRYVYAMSQGGELAFIDRKTGKTTGIQPLHPEIRRLRFNWNAAFAQDPFNPCGIYYGSQFLHYSSDCGQNWQLLSPDLTTNDTAKLHQDKSGGLTFDVTSAENHCTIIAITPSALEKGLVWVGTDDGNVQLTRDGGKTWENMTDRMPGCPKGAWVPQIEVSSKNKGEAFVVVNNYRQNDWQPYLYHTLDYGKKWKRLADPKNVDAFCLSVVQDPEVQNLLFLGTDQGLYFSLDYGQSWIKWTSESFPSVPVQDMKIQARDADLVIATFGRAIWVMDDIRPLRELAKKGAALLDQPFKVFPAPDAVMASVRSFDGPRFAAAATYTGHNKWPNANVTVWVKPLPPQAAKVLPKDDPNAKPKKEKAVVTILSTKGDTLRRYKTELDTGFNHIGWGFDTRGVRFPGNEEPDKEQLEYGGGPTVLPGIYKMVVAYGNNRDSALFRVLADPRLSEKGSDLETRAGAIRDFQNTTVTRATRAYERLKLAEKTIKLVEDQMLNVPDTTKKEVLKQAGTLRDSITALKETFFRQKEGKGIQRGADDLNSLLYDAQEHIGNGSGAPNAQAMIAINRAKQEEDRIIARINALFAKPWADFKTQTEAVKYSLFKNFDKL
jgi:photosystem II stability/assembly factor-like uncharacterized protein